MNRKNIEEYGIEYLTGIDFNTVSSDRVEQNCFRAKGFEKGNDKPCTFYFESDRNGKVEIHREYSELAYVKVQ